jgi:uncharacterized protein (TIGR02328 family)
MRLWHEQILPYLPTFQFNGQHEECCALRGNSWGKKHSTVNYVFDYPRPFLVEYHKRYLKLRVERGYNYDKKWSEYTYRGKNCEPDIYDGKDASYVIALQKRSIVYPEHDNHYLYVCVLLLLSRIQEKPDQYNEADRKNLKRAIKEFKIYFTNEGYYALYRKLL